MVFETRSDAEREVLEALERQIFPLNMRYSLVLSTLPNGTKVA